MTDTHDITFFDGRGWGGAPHSVMVSVNDVKRAVYVQVHGDEIGEVWETADDPLGAVEIGYAYLTKTEAARLGAHLLAVAAALPDDPQEP